MADAKPVQLNQDAKVPKESAMLDVAGWGVYDNNYTLSLEGPQSVEVKYVSNEACTRKPYRYPDHWITDDMLCASGKPGEGKHTTCSNITAVLVSFLSIK